MQGYRDGNPFAPQEFGLDFGSTGAPVTPNAYDTEGCTLMLTHIHQGLEFKYYRIITPNNIHY